MVYEKFIRDRITELRIEREVSEYKMSYDLGKNRSYINTITAGKALPSLTELFNIIKYFEITPAEFFDERSRCPCLVHAVITGMRDLPEEDLEGVATVVGRLCVMRAALDDMKLAGGREETEPSDFKTEKGATLI